MEGAAAVMAVAALATLYNSEQARGADAARLKELAGLYDRLKPPDYDLSISDPPELHAEAVKRPEFSGPMASPKFDTSRLRPEDLKLLGKYVPEIAPMVAEAAPQLVSRTAAGQTARDRQMKALESFTRIGESGRDPILEAQQAQAARAAQTEAQSRQASIQQDFARRGQGGSGVNLAAQLGGSAQAMDRAAMAAQEGAATAQRGRLEAMSQGAGLAGSIGRDDESMQARNAGIINDFNERTSRARQQWEQQRALSMSDANRFNTQAAQSLDNANVTSRNSAAVRERDRGDDLTRYGAEFARDERNRGDANAKWNYGADVDQRAYANDIAMQRARWSTGERDRHNDMLGQIYNQSLGRAGLKAGISSQMGQANIQRAQDQNAAISGAAQAYGSYAAGEAARSDNRYDQTRADDRQTFKTTGKWMSDEERKKRNADDYY